ncbi:MAG: GNAT family N-acetyltransferase [Halanaeroarchaeum sp.]
MYVRDAKKREEVWLLDRFEEFGFEDPAFRSRDYVIAIDEDAGRKVGFGRIRIHSEASEFCEVTCVGVLPDWRGQGVGAHVVERLVENARDQGFEVVYAFTSETDYFEQFGFEGVAEDELAPALQNRLANVRGSYDPDAVPIRVAVSGFSVPTRLRRRFENDDEEPEESPEDFGIDPDSATYKYDTGGR